MEAETKEVVSDNVIKLNRNENLLKLKIVDENGKDTGECLVFDLEDIKLPLRYQKLVELDKKNRITLQNQLTIIDKKQDHKGKKLYSANEEAKLKATIEFFEKQTEVYNMFLGENGVQKLLNGRNFGWTTLKEIDNIIEEQIYPKLEDNSKNIKKKIMEKYSNNIKRDDVIE